MTHFFIHIPKTAGTTFIEILRRDPANNIGFFYPPPEEMKDFEGSTKQSPHYHLEHNPDWRKYNFIVGHFTFGIHEVFKATSFKYLTVMREPIAQYISVYRMLLRLDPLFQDSVMPGNKQIEKLLNLDFTHNMQTFYLSGLSQQEIRDDKERAFEVAISNINRYFEGIGLTEKFDQGLFYFKHKIGTRPLLYSKRNVAKNSIEHEITPKVLEQIKAANDIDLRIYKYVEDQFEQEYQAISGIDRQVRLFKVKNKLSNLFSAV